MAHGFVGDLLIRQGIVDQSALTRALEAQAKQANTLGRALADLGVTDEKVVASALASALRVEFLDGEVPEVSQEARGILPADFCRKRRAFPERMREPPASVCSC
jgi:hypothetical protein